MTATPWWYDYDLDDNQRRALTLDDRPERELTDDERSWLDKYKRNNAYPLADDYCVGRGRAIDLGVGMGGLELTGCRWLTELGTGNVNVGGGWCLRVGTREDERGWYQGWFSQLVGLDAFLEAMGMEPVPGAGDEIGVFDSETQAHEKLVERMLAVLSIVSAAALDAEPGSEKVRSAQEAASEVRLAEDMLEFTRRLASRLEGTTPGGGSDASAAADTTRGSR